LLKWLGIRGPLSSGGEERDKKKEASYSQMADQKSIPDRLSQITTLWSVVGHAHSQPGEAVVAAQRQLLERYGGAIRRYLLAAVRDPDGADELFQTFAYRFLHGDLRGANRERGRFRDYLKGVLYHLAVDYHKRPRAQPLPAEHSALVVEPPSVADSDRDFLTSWRDELLAHAWAALERFERDTGQPYFTVLRYRADHPDTRSPQMAKELSARLGNRLTSSSVRQSLHRAREKFADLLLEEVVQSLESPSSEALVQELIELELWEYCRPALERRKDE
jgi:RNA polymerase sigma-70 factor (ECF subfamily)